MRKLRMKPEHFSRLKTGLIVIAVMIWAYMMKGIWDRWQIAGTVYLGRTLLVIIVVYILLLLMELWVDYEDFD